MTRRARRARPTELGIAAVTPLQLRSGDVADLVERTRRASAEARRRNAQWMRREGGADSSLTTRSCRDA